MSESLILVSEKLFRTDKRTLTFPKKEPKRCKDDTTTSNMDALSINSVQCTTKFSDFEISFHQNKKYTRTQKVADT